MLVILAATIPYLYEAIPLAIRNDVYLVLSFAREDETARFRYLLASGNSRVLGLGIYLARFRLLGLLGSNLLLILSNSSISELFTYNTYYYYTPFFLF